MAWGFAGLFENFPFQDFLDSVLITVMGKKFQD